MTKTCRLRVLLLDAHDSFTYNLAHAYAELGAVVDVIDIDEANPTTIASRTVHPHVLIVLGPGPRGPGRLVELVRWLDGRWPMMGVCLGLQAIVVARGGTVARAKQPMHGKRSQLAVDNGSVLFSSLPSSLWVMRYHSLVATVVPSSLRVCATDGDHQCMAVVDDGARLAAVQFHPESLGTAGGMQILANSFCLAGLEAPVVRHRPGNIPEPGDVGPGFPAAWAVLAS